MNEFLDNIRIKNKTLTILLPREIDDHVASILRNELDRRISTQRISEIVFDFSKTCFMDSSGIGMILGRFKKMQFVKGSVKIVNVSERLFSVMEMSGLHKIIEIKKGGAV